MRYTNVGLNGFLSPEKVSRNLENSKLFRNLYLRGGGPKKTTSPKLVATKNEEGLPFIKQKLQNIIDNGWLTRGQVISIMNNEVLRDLRAPRIAKEKKEQEKSSKEDPRIPDYIKYLTFYFNKIGIPREIPRDLKNLKDFKNFLKQLFTDPILKEAVQRESNIYINKLNTLITKETFDERISLVKKHLKEMFDAPQEGTQKLQSFYPLWYECFETDPVLKAERPERKSVETSKDLVVETEAKPQ